MATCDEKGGRRQEMPGGGAKRREERSVRTLKVGATNSGSMVANVGSPACTIDPN